MRRALLALLLIGVVTLSGCGAEPYASAPGQGVFAQIPEVVREVEPSVVAVLTDIGQGSGVIWSADGLVVTNNHVVANTSRIELAFADGKRSPARVMATDPLTDLAILETERRSLPAAEFATALPVVGELAIAVGTPLGFENTVTAGIVSGLHRSIPGAAVAAPALVDLIQTDAAISPGNSGGALVDAEGKVIGINVAYIPPLARAVSIGFAIPAPTVRDIVADLLDDGRASHPFFGMLPAQLTPQIARQLGVERDIGVLVLELVPGGPAEQAGSRPGDIVVAVEGKPVQTVEDFLGALRTRDPGEKLTVKISREGEETVLTVTLAERPTS